VIIALLLLLGVRTYSQIVPITLNDAIEQLAHTYEYGKIKKDSIIHHYEHRLFKATALPQITLSGTLPNYNRSISLVTQPEGDDLYVMRSYASSDIGLGISQLLPFTGGSITFSSNLQRQDNFNLATNKYAYYFNLFNLSYSQTLFAYNAYKWNKKIDRLSKSIEDIAFYQQREAVKQKIVELFFNLLIEQRKQELCEENLNLYKYVYEQSQKLYKSHRMSQEDMLAAKIEYLKAADATNEIDLNNVRSILKAYLKWEGEVIPKASFDESLLPHRELDIHYETVIEKAIKYNYTMAKDLNVLQKSIELKQIKKSVNPTVSLSIGSGYNSQFQSFSELLNDKSSRLSASISISIPIYNGGSGKYKKVIANTQLEQLGEQYQNKKASAAIEYKKELESINLLIRSIQNGKESITLIKQRLKLLKLNIAKGRIDLQQLMQTQIQQLKTVISYHTQIQQLYMLIYKYRSLSLIDIRENKELLSGIR
jgi:outer membrane protein TolC